MGCSMRARDQGAEGGCEAVRAATHQQPQSLSMGARMATVTGVK